MIEDQLLPTGAKLYEALDLFRNTNFNDFDDSKILELLNLIKHSFITSNPACRGLSLEIIIDLLPIIIKKYELLFPALERIEQSKKLISEISNPLYPILNLGKAILKLGSLQNEACDLLYGFEN